MGATLAHNDNNNTTAGNDPCTISGNVNNGNVTNEGVCTGGVVGILRGNYWTISDCTNNGVITGKGALVGGIVGVTNFTNVTITDCVNSEEASVTGSTFVGGIIGALGYDGDRTTTKAINCINNGLVTGTATSSTVDGASKAGNRVGGIAGFAYGSTVQNCSNTGKVRTLIGETETVATKSYVGAASNSIGLLVGYKTTNAKVIEQTAQ